MAGAIPSTKHEKLNAQQIQEDPSKFYYHFLYKAVIVAIFLVILPLFPSQAPEFINQSLLTRNWELLHLLFVGIAISYGLFSRRNDETEKENSSKFDSAQSFVSRILQVSSFFEDEAESPSESDENKVQTWSNQYYRNEPAVVVAPQHSNFYEQSATSSRNGEKPLLLPVRSLKYRVSDPSAVLSVNESSASCVSLNRSSSKSGFKKFSNGSSKARNGGMEGSGSPKGEDKLKDNVVLPSPIPWRSRSGRMETKQEVDTPTHYASSPSAEESRSVKSQTSRSSRPNSMSSSPKLTPSSVLSSPKELSSSPSPSFRSESLAKNAEDLVRKKVIYKSCPPPPPPPPPIFQKSISMRPRSSTSFNEGASSDKEMKRSFTSERKDLNWSSRDKLMGRVDSGIEAQPGGLVPNVLMGRSVRTVGAGQNVAAVRRGRDFGEGTNGRVEKSQLEAEEHFMEEAGRHEHMSFRTDKLVGHGSVPLVWEPDSMEFAEEDKVIMEFDEDTETEDEDVGGSLVEKDSGESRANEESSKTDSPGSSSVGEEGPDVDKKADEFIAKFREQIRLQRIESIKRSARITKNSSR